MIEGGTVATESAVFAAEVVIEDGRIAALAEPGAGPAADERIDASGLVVMPGAIDMHAHFEDPGHTEREDFTTGTMAAAAGGITTVFEHPLTYPPVTTTALYREARDGGAQGRGRFRPVGCAHPDVDSRDRRSVGRGRGGVQGVHACLGSLYPHVTDAEFLDGMREVRAVGGLVLVHAESDSLLQAGIARMRAAGRVDTMAHHEARPPFVEEEAVHRALYLAAHAGVRIQIVHVLSPSARRSCARRSAPGGR